MNTIAAIPVVTGIVSALIIGVDLLRYRQSMKIMNPVWVLTGLWAGIFGLIAYFWFGRHKFKMSDSMRASTNGRMSMPADAKTAMTEMKIGHKEVDPMNMDKMDMEKMDMSQMDHMDLKTSHKWQSVTLSTLHCGAGCTLADLIGEWSIYLFAIVIGGSVFISSVVVDYILALLIGVYFQYSAIRSMSSMPHAKIISKAFKADFFSLTAWQIGMYGFMALAIFVIFPHETISKTSWLFWFMMQIAMLTGFVFSFPVNLLLIKFGVKKAM